MSSIENIKHDLENDDIFTLAYRGGAAQLGETSQPDDEWLNTTSEEGSH